MTDFLIVDVLSIYNGITGRPSQVTMGIISLVNH